MERVARGTSRLSTLLTIKIRCIVDTYLTVFLAVFDACLVACLVACWNLPFACLTVFCAVFTGDLAMNTLLPFCAPGYRCQCRPPCSVCSTIDIHGQPHLKKGECKCGFGDNSTNVLLFAGESACTKHTYLHITDRTAGLAEER